MKTIIIILVLILAGFAAVFFLPQAEKLDENKFESQILDSQSYPDAASEIALQINELSPTPPTEDRWTVREVEFVKNEPYAYVVYHDTHNIFRMLVEIGENGKYRTIATFEADKKGWRLAHGEDLARLPAPEGAADGGQAKGMVIYIYNPELKLWIERKE